MFKHIAVAIDFSPFMDAILAEGKRLSYLYGTALSVIHIGEDDPQLKEQLREAIRKADLNEQSTQVFWEPGDPVEKIMSIACGQGVDLLIAAANKKKNLLEYYTGSVARDLLRNAYCSVLLYVRPGEQPAGFRHIVIKAGELEESRKSIHAGCLIGQQEKAGQLQVIKQVKMYGFTMAVASEGTAEEYLETKEELFEDEIREVEAVLDENPTEGLAIDVKIVKEKYGPALARITKKSRADLLIVAAPEGEAGLLAKIFPTDLEYLLKDLPCNLLMVQTDQAASGDSL